VSGHDELIAALAEEMPSYISATVRFQVAVAHQLGMPVTDVHALAALLEAGPVGVSRLAELMGTTAGAATRVADRLERAGFVRREPDPDDRRRIVLQLVPERVAAVAQYYEPMDARWRRQIAGYSDDQLRFVLEFIREGRESAQAETAALRASGRSHGTRRRRRGAP
jgi:DNA-binding MarR family transcriptional regulator